MKLNFHPLPGEELRKIYRDELFDQNSVVVGAIGMCPVVAMGISLQNALLLGLLMAILMIPTCLFSALCLKNVARWIRTPILCLTASALYGLAMLVINELYIGFFEEVSLYAPILVVSSVLLTHADRCAEEENAWRALAYTIGGSLGFLLVLVLVGSVRESLTFGTVAGRKIFRNYHTVSAIAMPFFGMILIGYIGAIFKKIGLSREKQRAKHKKREEETT